MDKNQDILSKLKYKQPASPGTTYFEELAASIHHSESKTKVVPLYKKQWVYIGLTVAASLVLFFSIYSDKPTDNVVLADELSHVEQDQVLAYIDEHIDDFDVELLGEFVIDLEISEELMPATQVEINTENTEDISFEKQIDEINKEEILEYFNEQGIDPGDTDEFDFI